MSEMVAEDVKNGMALLMNKLLPMVIENIKAQEKRIAALESKLESAESKPKRTRKKKEAAPAEPCEQDAKSAKVCELYTLATGDEMESLAIGTSSDGAAMLVNGVRVDADTIEQIKTVCSENPAATPQDISDALQIPLIAVCYVMVMFNLYDFIA